MNTGIRRYRIKSRFRFTAFIVIVMLLIVGGLSFVTGTARSTATTVDEYTTYTVCAGDTLWSIADEYRDEATDARKAIFVISKVNDIKAEDLQPGMVLTIPTDL